MEKEEAREDVRSPAAGDRPRVLIVEDQIGPRESLKLVLSSAYTVIVAENGAEGLEQFEKWSPELVVSDIRMPRMNGIDFMRRLKQRSPDTPFIILTGYGSLETAQEAVRAGAFDYLSKPYDIEHLRQLASRAIASVREKREREEAVAELHAMNRQLEEQMRDLKKQATVGEISTQMVHDLNNPLFVLQGYIHLLEEKIGGGDDERHEEKEYIETIREQIVCCSRLTKGFLNYARNNTEDWSETEINRLVQDTVVLLRLNLEKSHIEIAEDLAEDLPLLSVQYSALQQVIYNLLINALQVLDADGGRLRIETGRTDATVDAGAGVYIAVQDNGPGIPDAYVDKIFASYFTTRQEGTGLGLATCKRIVEEHSGRIEVDTEEGVGSTFYVYLPVSSGACANATPSAG